MAALTGSSTFFSGGSIWIVPPPSSQLRSRNLPTRGRLIDGSVWFRWKDGCALDKRQSDRVVLLALEALLRTDGRDAAMVVAAHLPHAVALFPHAVEQKQAKNFPHLVERIAKYLENSEHRPAVRAAWQTWIRPIVTSTSISYDHRQMGLARAGLQPELVREFLQDADEFRLHEWDRRQLLGAAVRVAPQIVLPRLQELWRIRIDWEQAKYDIGAMLTSAIHAAPQAVLTALAVEIGFEAAAGDRSSDGPESTRDYLGQYLQMQPVPAVPRVVAQQATLWSLLRRLKNYERWSNPPEVRGVRRELATLIETDPDAWSRALPHILARVTDIPDAESLTTVAAFRTPAVRAALDDAATRGATTRIRDRAKGILATLDGFARPGAELADELLAFAAREFDGTPIFPHPLGMRGSTWIADPTAEALLRDGIDRAAMRFAEYFRDQGAVDEEAVTAQLLAELEFAFRATQARARHVTAAARVPIGLVERRQVPKDEEDQIGCDLALIVRADVRGAISAVWAEFVQVKKPERRGTQFFDRWRITLETQLDDLLRTSPTSCYWLIGAAGEVFAVPAKLLLGIKRGRGSAGKTMNVSYREVRSAAIPLSQFILDVLAGAWIGSMDDGVVRVARGEDRGFRPREVFEITLHIGQRG